MSWSVSLATFTWDGETWAFELPDVVEVVGTRSVTPLPGMSPPVLGISTWRGRTLPVLAPRPLKDSPDPPDVKRRLLVLRRPAPFAVPVDEPGRVIDASAAEVVDRPMEMEGSTPDGVRLVRVDGIVIRVLDPCSLVARGTVLATRGEPSARRKS